MISIVVCSICSSKIELLLNSIDKTANVEYEVIIFENSIDKFSIAKVYNQGALNAKFPYLVFVHEDVVFQTKGWGETLLHFFNILPNPGVLGIAGSSYLPISPSDWWVSKKEYLHMNFYSNSKGGQIGEGVLKRNGVQMPQRVYAIDGMFLAMKKVVWEEFTFDESLSGFHGYDTSICYRISQKYQNYFIPDILIEHFSKGYPNEIWLLNTISANKSILRFILENHQNREINEKIEVKSFQLFLGQLRKYYSSYIGSVKFSSYYLFKLNSCFISLRSFWVWFYFQILYLKKLFK